MDRQTLNRLKYLRQNQQYLSNREQTELAKLERQLNTESAIKADEERLSRQQAEMNRERNARQEEENARIIAAQSRRAKRKAREVRKNSQQSRKFESTIDTLSYQNIESQVDSIEEVQNLKKVKKPKRPFSIKRFFKRLFVVIGILIVAIIALFIFILNDVEDTLKKTYVDTGNTSMINPKKPLTFVLMGVDTGDSSRGGSNSWNGNSDSQIVMTLNPKTSTTTMVSMERDTMTPILDDTGQSLFTQKMNAAYPFGYNAGGISLASQYAMMTIGAQAGISINNFVIINMDGLVNLVNDVGGIDVVNDSGGNITIANTEPQYTATVPYIKGNPPQHINGDQALVFARDRDTLPNGDYGRAAHQREVLTAVFKKLLTLNTALHYHKVLSDISMDFKTNVHANMSTLFSLAAYKNCFNKTVSIQYQGVSATAADSSGIYASYQLMPQNVDLAVQNLLRRSIGKSVINSVGENVITYESYFGEDPTGYFMPSAAVTQKGKTATVYGVDKNGNLVTIDSNNSNTYVGTTGSPIGN